MEHWKYKIQISRRGASHDAGQRITYFSSAHYRAACCACITEQIGCSDEFLLQIGNQGQNSLSRSAGLSQSVVIAMCSRESRVLAT
jgi:hypothetical protein